MWQSRSAQGVSVLTLYQFIVGLILWEVYGIYKGDPVIIAANIVGLIVLFLTLGLYYWLRSAHTTVKVHLHEQVDTIVIATNQAD